MNDSINVLDNNGADAIVFGCIKLMKDGEKLQLELNKRTGRFIPVIIKPQKTPDSCLVM